MELSISPVQPEDVDLLVRKVEYPAHKNGPLHLLMFPRPKEQELEKQRDQKEDEIKWMIDGILDAVCREDILYNACGGDGLPVD